ncbi:MAG: ABC transporter permease, partial [Bryobacteraceae bacterium]
MLIESLLLSLLGGAAGLAAAQWTNRILERGLSSAPVPIAVGASLSLDGRVLGFVLIASVLTTLLFGLIPALQASRPDLVPALKGSGPFSRNRRLTLRNVSVVAQVALSLVLLIVAGLFLRALRTASGIDPGFDAGRLLSARLYVAKPEFNQVTGVALYHRVLDRARALPGVQNATLSYASPMLTMSECVVPEKATASLGSTTAGANIVGPNYFSTFGIPLIRGRDFIGGDNTPARPVVIVNETLARRYWPGQNPVGNRIRVGNGCGQGLGTLAEIVGVAKDARYASLDAAVRPYIFYPFDRHFVGYVALVIRTGRNPAGLASPLRKELRDVDSRLRIYDIATIS